MSHSSLLILNNLSSSVLLSFFLYFIQAVACNATITGRNQNNGVGPPPITMVGDDPHLNYLHVSWQTICTISIRHYASEQALLPL